VPPFVLGCFLQLPCGSEDADKKMLYKGKKKTPRFSKAAVLEFLISFAMRKF